MATILCLDDEKSIVNALRRQLRCLGYNILTATKGAEALELIMEHECAVVISDMRMPEMDGAEFFRRVLELQPHTFRILLTGYADLGAAISVVNAGEIHRYLAKPWNADELAQAVGQGLERYELIQENLSLTDSLFKRSRTLEELNATLEQQVQERSQQLLHSEKLAAVGRVAAGLVHEVSAPLGVVSGYVELMQKDEGIDPDHQRSLQMISEGIRRATGVIDKLREATKKKVRAKQSVDLNELLEYSIGLIEHKLNQCRVVLRKDLVEVVKIWADEGQLSQVLLNLINNALDEMNGGVLTVRTRMLLSDIWGEMVEVDVADTGPGISKENLSRVFEPFYTTKGENGTGLGLPICLGIVEAHGGELTVDSKVGCGSTFRIRLPLGDPVE